MSHITKEEYLSAFVDGEAGSFEEHRICDQLLTDESMREKVSSFALIGETMRDDSQIDASVARPSFLSAIQDAIQDDEPLAVIPGDSAVVSLDAVRAKKKRTLPKQAFGYAVAASVAAVAAISFQNYANAPKQDQQMMSASLANVNALIPSSVNTAAKPDVEKASKALTQTNYIVATSFKTPDAKTKGLMDKLVAHHLQYASSSTLMPRVRAVSYSTDF